MDSITVSGLDDAVVRQLVEQAKRHGRSLEAEVRDIVTSAVRPPHIGLAFLHAAREVGGFEGLEIPARV